jgi:hypothetical protein
VSLAEKPPWFKCGGRGGPRGGVSVLTDPAPGRHSPCCFRATTSSAVGLESDTIAETARKRVAEALNPCPIPFSDRDIQFLDFKPRTRCEELGIRVAVLPARGLDGRGGRGCLMRG